jgi:hypothetical protein
MASTQTKAYVSAVGGREKEIETLKKLVLAGGCALTCTDEPPDAFEQCVTEADVLVILICPETENDPLVRQAIEAARASGKRIVGVWLPGLTTGTLPPLLHRYGSAAVPMDAEKIAAAVCGGSSVWDTPSGTPRPKPLTPRHKG